jgi:hypothetical protein
MINWSSISDAQRAEIVRARRKQLAYKTELCRQFRYVFYSKIREIESYTLDLMETYIFIFRDTNNCEFGLQCRFAHGTDELRTRPVIYSFLTSNAKPQNFSSIKSTKPHCAETM